MLFRGVFCTLQPPHEGNHDMKQQPYEKVAKAEAPLPVFALNRAARRKAFATNNPRSVRKGLRK